MQPAAAGSAAVGLLSIVVLQNEKNGLKITPCFCLIINYSSPFLPINIIQCSLPKVVILVLCLPCHALLSDSPSIYYL